MNGNEPDRLQLGILRRRVKLTSNKVAGVTFLRYMQQTRDRSLVAPSLPASEFSGCQSRRYEISQIQSVSLIKFSVAFLAVSLPYRFFRLL